MKIRITEQTNVGIGGALTFNSNFRKAIKPYAEVLPSNSDDTLDYDILLITGATLIDRETVQLAKRQGKKIVLRVDNILEDCKNRNTGMPRLRDYAKLADKVIYQSNWAKKVLAPYCGDGEVVHNGVDTDIFYPRKEKKTWNNIRVFYSKFSRNETKNFHEVIWFWREYCLERKDDILVLVGRYAQDKFKVNNPFEFHNEEKFEYKGVLEDPKTLADCMRNCDIAFLPYSHDACSNTILECQACGLPTIYDYSGGTEELIHWGGYFDRAFSPQELVDIALDIDITRKSSFLSDFSLEAMGKNYFNILNNL